MPVEVLIMTQPFVERRFEMSTGEGQAELVYRVMRPVPWKGAFRCDYEIATSTVVLRASKAYGEDGLQALLLALSISVVEIELALRKAGGSVDASHLADLARLRLP